MTPHQDPLLPLTQVGTMALIWHFSTLLPVTVSLLLTPMTSLKPEHLHSIATAIFFTLLALSRLGLWTYNLVEQTIVQISVSPVSRAEFSGVEIAIMSAAEIDRWGITVIFPKLSHFKGVAMSGLAVVSVSLSGYARWNMSLRG